MNAQELKNILHSHALWLRTNGAEGSKANLMEANLTGTILEKNKTVSSVSATFGDELNAKIAEIESFLDKHGMKLASPISILPK